MLDMVRPSTPHVLTGLVLGLVLFAGLDAALAFGAAQVWPEGAREAGRRFSHYRVAADLR
jgi:hypothetical protein